MRQHTGDVIIVVTCVSPNDVRKIKYCYHFDNLIDAARARATARADARAASYKAQGWFVRVATQKVDTLSPRARRALRKR